MAKILDKTIAHDNRLYKTDGESWSAMMWGTYGPSCNGIPSWKWMPIPSDKVPDAVKREA